MRYNLSQKAQKSLFMMALCSFLPSLIFAQGLFQMNGNGSQADLGGNCYRLTTATNNQFGSMWYRKKADLTQDFDLTANLNFGTADAGADGIVFAFQNVCSSAGGGGGGIGIFGVSPSFFVEFDTWSNGNYNDPSYDHLAILKNGDVTHGGVNSLVAPTGIVPSNGNVENGQDYLVRIWWTAADTTFRVFVNNDLRATYTGNIVSQIFSGSPYVYWGFTAATGGANNLHRVCMLTFPNNEVALDDISICEGSSQQVNLPGGTTYSWSPNYNISSTTVPNPFLFPLVTTTYIVSITDACSNVQTDTMVVTVNPLPTVSFTAPFTQKCLNDPATGLSGASPSGGTYSGPGVTAGSFDPSAAGAGNHALVYSYTDSFGCTNSDTSWVNVFTLPNVTLTPFNTQCTDAPAFTLTGGSPSGGTYSGPGVTAGSFNPAAAGNGTHTITYTYTNTSGCSGTATETITVNPVPAASISTPTGTVLCSGASVTLQTSAVNGVSYQWLLNGNPLGSLDPGNTSYTATMAGTYTLYAQSSAGCSATSAAVTITNGSTPTANITALNTSICPGQSTVINSSLTSNETVEWFRNGNIIPGQNGADLIVNQDGAYYVVITSATGCTATSNTINVNLLAGVNASLSAPITAFCPGTSNILLSATVATGATYEWYNGSTVISGATGNSYNASSAGSYWVVITASSGCADTSNTVVLINGVAPTAQISAPVTSICQGLATDITAVQVNGASYMWHLNGSMIAGSTNVISATQPGNYEAIVTGPDGCTAVSNTITISVQQAPNVVLSANTTSLCPGANVLFTANLVNGATYEWFRNNISLGAPAINANTYTAAQTGTYHVVVNDGCSGSSNTVLINSGTLPGDVTTIFGPVYACGGEVVSLSTWSVTGATYYEWTISPPNAASIATGQGTTDIEVNLLNTSVTITCTPQNACGNGGASTEPVTIDNSFCFGVQFGAYPTNTCIGSSVTFYNYTDNSQYIGLTPSWTFGPGASPATATGNGPHVVTYSTSGLKTVSLDYVDNFGNSFAYLDQVDYVNVSGTVSTSAISGNTMLTSCNGTVENYSVNAVSGSDFQWTVPANAVILSGQGTNQITLSFGGNGGNISVVQTNANGCVGAPVNVYVDCMTTGMDNDYLSETTKLLQVIPNPATEKIRLGFSGVNGMAYLYNISGDLLKKELVTQATDMDVQHLPAGIYFIHLLSESGNYKGKLIKQ